VFIGSTGNWKLNLHIKPRKRLARQKPQPLAVPVAINTCWSMDFMHDQFEDGRSYRLFNVIDDYNMALGGITPPSSPSHPIARSTWRMAGTKSLSIPNE
jgi:putative transposase